MGRKLRLTETELVNLIQKVISEQSTPPGPNGYPGGVPCYACILNHPVMRTFPQNAVTSNGECAPTGYGYQGTQYALPGGSASYSYPSIWSTSQPTNCGNTTPDTPCYDCVNGTPTVVETIGPNSSWCQSVPNGPQCGNDCTQIQMNNGQFPLTSDPNLACGQNQGDWWCDPTGAFVSATGSPCIQSPTQPQSYFTGPSPTEQDCITSCGTGGGTASCNKDCTQLVPSTFAGLIANKQCNWLNNRYAAFTNKLATKTPGSCQHKRIECKMGMVKERRIQLGCSNLPD
jgi:hypothetical protein